MIQDSEAMQPAHRTMVLCAVFLGITQIVPAADWPCYRGNPERTGATADTLTLPLRAAWIFQTDHPPSPAFKDTIALRRDGRELGWKRRQRLGRWGHGGLAEPATHDYVFQPVVAEGRVYFGSSTDEAVYCLDAATGETAWKFTTEGAVRFAPMVEGGRVFVGSDDGNVYCLDAADGSQQWAVRAAPDAGHCIGNGRPIAAWPVRGGITLVNGVVYCGAGVFPKQGVYLSAISALTGKILWQAETYCAIHGQLLIDGQRLWAPTYRTAPAPFNLADGNPALSNTSKLELLSRGGAEMQKIDGLVAGRGRDDLPAYVGRVQKGVRYRCRNGPKGASHNGT